MRRSQKRKKDSHVKQLFALLGSACVKAASKNVDEIDPWSVTSKTARVDNNDLHDTPI